MKWLFFRYRVFLALWHDHIALDAWVYSAAFKEYMFEGLCPKWAVEWEKTFGAIERYPNARVAKVIYDPDGEPKWIVLNPGQEMHFRF